MAQAKTFVLVHGAWHGGWCWRRLADLLTRRGHKVFTPTLTGLADRSHLMSEAIGLGTHIADIVNLMRWEDLRDVVLVGHSYGGMVISGVAEAMEGTIGSLVYLDAFLPQDGQALADLMGEAGAGFRAMEGNGPLVLQPMPAAFFKVNAGDAAWVDRQLTPHPFRTFTDRIRLTGARERIPRKVYILARGFDAPNFAHHYECLKADPAWETHELACGHDVMLDMPEALAGLLLAA